MIKISLKPRKEESLLRYHPWVFSGAIARIDGKPAEGELVRVTDCNDNFLAVGHYQTGSISVRVLSFVDEKIDNDFWQKRIVAAYSLRHSLGLINGTNDTYRLVHGEGDSLPGLIIDVYADTAVMQAHSAGMHRCRNIIAQIIIETIPTLKNVYYKSESTLPINALSSESENSDGYLIGQYAENHIATENGLKFSVDWQRGQKTGFFIDQRENRELLQRYSGDKTVLNMFCYTGGFSAYALQGGAQKVVSVDSSAKAIELTNRNININFPNDKCHSAFADDAFKFMSQSAEQYDIVVLDPPAFAKRLNAVPNALRGYQKLNAAGIKKVKNGGLLFTFSCSQAVSRQQFRLAVLSAAVESKRTVRILHQLSQPADHPVSI
ncbi:MAG: class I SAM-dependent rRNA methyltransferase, partial [Paludibacter sp.]|nr:class I SAM-dependent rRNA methyltransferase [Paludibacter sp.]